MFKDQRVNSKIFKLYKIFYLFNNKTTQIVFSYQIYSFALNNNLINIICQAFTL